MRLIFLQFVARRVGMFLPLEERLTQLRMEYELCGTGQGSALGVILINWRAIAFPISDQKFNTLGS